MLSEYARTLNEIVDKIYDTAAELEMTDVELGEKAKLCPATIYRLAHRITKEPRFSTVWKLCKAVGLTLTVAQQKAMRKRRAA